MKKWFTHLAFAFVAGVAGLLAMPDRAIASFTSSAIESPTPIPTLVQPAAPDFSDADFAQADQPEWGTLTGGDAAGLLIFILVVVLLVLLILWLLRQDGHQIVVR
ncbi:MAG TPA: hypothetical protein VL860_12265 [Planctomycetota bacterium]|nr:hypothetical protein [Planctomycetota bacterium]